MLLFTFNIGDLNEKIINFNMFIFRSIDSGR